MMSTVKWLNADPWTVEANLIPLQRVCLFLQHTALYVYSSAPMVHAYFTMQSFLWYPLVCRTPKQFFPFPDQWTHSVSLNCCSSVYLSYSCLSAIITSVVDFPVTNPNCSSLIHAHDVSQSILICTLR